jgi:holo-[acyl-carrier protein] synthase
VTGQVVGLGLDLVDIDRFRALLERRPAMKARLFTPGELDLAGQLADPAPTLAGRFAVKEAVMKSLGVGIGAVDWTDMHAPRRPGGAPALEVTGRAGALAASLGVSSWRVSISHTGTTAGAVVVALS